MQIYGLCKKSLNKRNAQLQTLFELIDKKEFTAMALDENAKMSIVYIKQFQQYRFIPFIKPRLGYYLPIKLLSGFC